MGVYIGNETFSVGGRAIALEMSNFWRWAYSNLSNNINRSVFAKFIVASSLGIAHMDAECFQTMCRPFDLQTKDGHKVEVKSAAYVQSWDSKHPEHISFQITPTRMPYGIRDYKSEASMRRNSEVYVFCIYKALSKDESPLNLDLWEFYVLSTKKLDDKIPTQKTISFHSLMQLEPIWSDYYGIGEAINAALSA